MGNHSKGFGYSIIVIIIIKVIPKFVSVIVGPLKRIGRVDIKFVDYFVAIEI